MSRTIPDDILKQRRDWWLGYVWWVAIYWTLSGFATVSAALAAALPEDAKVFGIIAAGSSSLIGVGNPYRRANAFTKAYRRLNQACLEFEYNDAVTVETLLKAHLEGETILEESEK